MLCKCLTNTNYNLRIINNHCFKENNKYQIKYIQVNIYHNVYLFLPPIIVFKTTRDSYEERERERDKERERQRVRVRPEVFRGLLSNIYRRTFKGHRRFFPFHRNVSYICRAVRFRRG